MRTFSLPVATSQSFTQPSSPPVAISWPSGLNARAVALMSLFPVEKVRGSAFDGWPSAGPANASSNNPNKNDLMSCPQNASQPH